jgi:chaperonin cofactor prefoldin
MSKGQGKKIMNSNDMDIKEMDARIKAMKKSAEELRTMAEDFPAVYRNVSRALASIKMLELNLSDMMDQGLLS